jgi:23S rRNA pseudouridine955/2504/2580 synthase
MLNDQRILVEAPIDDEWRNAMNQNLTGIY